MSIDFSDMSSQFREAMFPDDLLVESDSEEDYSDKLANLDNNIIQMAMEAGFQNN